MKNKALAEVDSAVWSKDVAAMKALGVNLSEEHMTGYIVKTKRETDNQVTKPWEFDNDDEKRLIPKDTDPDNWKNQSLLFEIVSGVAYITLNRPEANNALNGDMDQGISDACAILRKRPDVRVAILQANGRMFCAGGDPKAFQQAQGITYDAIDKNAAPSGPSISMAAGAAMMNKKGARKFASNLLDFSTLPQYTITLIQGSCMGGGVGFASLGDWVISVKNAQFVLSEVRLGVIAATISPYVISKLGAAKAKEWFCTAAPWKAPRMLQEGFINQVVDKQEEFGPIVKGILAQIQGLAPGAVAKMKKTLVRLYNAPLGQSLLDFTVGDYCANAKEEEAKAGLKAVEEKKKPVWAETPILYKE
jgi:methylglutaconyl-CoA hydratase